MCRTIINVITSAPYDAITHLHPPHQPLTPISFTSLMLPSTSTTPTWYQIFTDRGHICLEFEHLDKSLHDFMRERYFRPLPLKEIRPIVQQLANALYYLKAAWMMHADLKLENVMLVNQQHEPYWVKVIDFGLACDVSSARQCSYIPVGSPSAKNTCSSN